MKYKLTITKQEPNPAYDARQPRIYTDQVEQYRTLTVLDVEVDEATFAVIRKAALETL